MTPRRGSEARAAVDSSFEELYRGYRAEVFRAALRELGDVHDAEDVTQAAFVDAYRAVQRGSRPHAPRAWLLAIAENVRRRRFRTAQRRPREEPLDEDSPVTADISHELAGDLAEALGALPPEQRQAFVLRELAGLSYEEIAAETDSTVGSIQMLLFRARRSLRERLEPPTVGRRGLVFPVPGWLAGLLSRAEVTLLTPRGLGAVGAAVVAVAASVTVNEVQPEAPARAAVEPPIALAAPAPIFGASVSTAVPRQSRPTSARPVGGRSGVTPTATTARRGADAAPPPGAEPVAEAAGPTESAIPAVPAASPPTTASAPQAPQLPVKATDVVATTGEVAAETTDEVVETADEVVEAASEAVEAATTPIAPALPPLPTEPIEDVAAGAAGAAGVGVPPLPVPVVPPVTLPPAP